VDADATNSTRRGVPLQALIVDPVEAPVYLRIADQAKHFYAAGDTRCE
jgi:hypothetical protein